MKQIKLKLLACMGILLFALPLFTSYNVQVTAAQYYEFYDDFEKEITGNAPSQWLAEQNGAIAVCEENGNKYLRLTPNRTWNSDLSTGAVVKTNAGLLSLPLTDRAEKIIIKASLRMGNLDGSRRSIISLSYPNNHTGNGFADYQLFSLRGTSFYGVGGNAAAPQYQVVQANTWYDVTAEIATDGTVAVSFYKDGTCVAVSTQPLTASGTLKNLADITNITWRTVSQVKDDVLDLDNVSVHCEYKSPTAKLLTDAESKISADSQIGIQFTKPIDEETLTAETVLLKNAEGETVVCTERSYDAKTKTYSMQPDEQMTVGANYSVLLSEEIYAANDSAETDIYAQGKLSGETLFFFTVSAPKSHNADLSAIYINGELIPGFNAAQESYTVFVDYEENLTLPTMTYAVADALAAVEVNGSFSLSEPFTAKNITITAEDGITKRTYSVLVKVVGKEPDGLGKNLLKNEGFEDGTIAPWQGSLTVTTEEACTGDYAAFFSPETETSLYTQPINLTAGKTYLASAWVKLKDEGAEGKKFYMYFDGAVNPSSLAPTLIGTTRKWKQIIRTCTTSDQSKNISAVVTPWAKHTYYLDDLYLGELRPIVQNTHERVVDIPQSGEKRIALETTIVNQLGTKDGLEKAEFLSWEITGETTGVYVDGAELVVTDQAEQGDVILKAVYAPNYCGAYAEQIKGKSIVTLTDVGTDLPQAKDIKVKGIAEVGNTLSVSYRYYQKNGDPEGNTELQWMWSDTENGTYVPILEGGAPVTALSYVVTQAYAEKFIRVSIQPKTDDGVAGVTVLSDSYAYKQAAPIAEDLMIDAPQELSVGDVMTASYTFKDHNGDEEDESPIRWLRSNNLHGNYEVVATGKTYLLTEQDINGYIKFEITPTAKTGNKTGATQTSAAVSGPVPPKATDVKIVNRGSGLFSASYTYSHAHGIGEGKSLLKWYIGQNEVGSGSTCIVKGDSGLLRLEVTPVALKTPYNGESVSATYSLSASGRESGGGGGGGGGFVVKPLPKTEEKAVEVTAEDSGAEAVAEPVHWAKGALEHMTQKGIMQAEDSQRPDEVITRESFLSCVLRALGVEAVEYQNIFNDVDVNGNFAGYLQAAVNYGIISEDVSFYPQRSVSREEICKILAEGLKVAEISTQTEATPTQFADWEAINPWAKDYVTKIVALGIMQGVSETEFMPRGVVTKGQTAVILERLIKLMETEKAKVEA